MDQQNQDLNIKQVDEVLQMIKKRNSQLHPDYISKVQQLMLQYQQKEKSIGSSKTDQFETFVFNTIYVDKTLLIKKIIDSNNHLFISAPQRWGKSLNLSMLMYFFQPDRNKENGQSQHNNTSLRQRKVNREELFRDLKIGKVQGDYITQYLGKNPVIYLNFISVSGDNYDTIVVCLKYAISDVFQQHQYLVQKLDKQSRDYLEFKAYLNRCNSYLDQNNNQVFVDIIFSISLLTRLLYEHYKNSVYILVDEFDKPVLSLFEQLVSEKDQTKIYEIKQTIKDAVAKGQGDKYVKKIILTGILNTVDKNASPLLNGLQEVNWTSSQMIDYFGFRKQEIIEQILIPIFETQENFQQLYDQLENWQNGYNFKQTNYLFNPFSLMSYLNELANEENVNFKTQWYRTFSTNILTDIVRSQNLTDDFKSKLILNLNSDLNSDQNDNSESLKKSSYQVLLDIKSHDKFDKLAFHILVKFGYLMLSDNKYVIPSYEVKQVFLHIFLPQFIDEKQLNVSIQTLYEVLEGDIDQFMEFIETKLLPILKPGQYTEIDFQALIYCLFHGNMIVQKMKNNKIQLLYEFSQNKALIKEVEWI